MKTHNKKLDGIIAPEEVQGTNNPSYSTIIICLFSVIFVVLLLVGILMKWS